MNRKATLVATTVLCAVAGACTTKAPPVAPSAEIWPTAGWAFSAPEAQGIDSDALARAIDTIRQKHIPIHSLFIERNGYAVVDAYFFPFENDETHDLASVTKSVTSSLVGIAWGERKLGALDQPVFAFLPEHRLADPRKQRIRLSDLLSMTSGLDCGAPPGVNLLLEMEHSADWVGFTLALPQPSEPGTRFEYCGGGMHVVSAALTRATGESAFDLARRELFAPLGIAHTVWPSDPHGVSRGFADLELEPPDAAKLGYLWLHHGRWEGRQIIPAEYLASALSAHANVQTGIQYGYGMWLYPGHRPFDFEANGRGGQRITMIPSENLVAVVTAGGADANIVSPLIAAAVKANSPLPPNEMGAARLGAAVAQAARAPAGFDSAPPPQWAAEIAGKTYAVSANPLGLRTLQFWFDRPYEALALFGFTDGRIDDHLIGLDGVPRLSEDTAARHRVALLGKWRGNGFDLDYDEVARIDDYRLRIVPAAGGLTIHLIQRTGPVDMMLTATPE